MMTLGDLQKGAKALMPVYKRPARNEWYDTNSSVNLNTFGFPDNFEDGFNFVLPFYIDRNVRKILEVGLTLTFQKFRGYTLPLSHTHSVIIGDHTHGVTIGDHTHGVTIGNHTHNVTIGSHTHGVTIGNHTHSLSVPVTANASPPGAPIYINYLASPHLQANIAGNDELFLGYSTTGAGGGTSVTSASGGGTTVSSAAGGGTTVTSAAGGGTTVTSAAGGGTTVTSSSGEGAEYGVFEDTYASDVHVFIDGVDITANLGGEFNPIDGSNVFPNMDLTPFIKEGGLHVLELSSSTRGRALPLLWVKSIISRTSK